jgi:CRISPR-associated protein Csm1
MYMNIDVEIITLAAFLHDIGKLAERANVYGDIGSKDNAENPRHKHATHTAAYLNQIMNFLPASFANALQGESLITLASQHHNPVTPLQWIITLADRLSIGLTSINPPVGNENESKQPAGDTRLLPIAEQIDNLEKPEAYRFRYKIKELSLENIFPSQDVEQGNSVNEYKALLKAFTDGLASLEHKDNPNVWFEHFDSLYQIIASQVPSISDERDLPDISLYDHSKTTAAIATALYLFHSKTGTLTVEAVQDCKTEKFVIINGDFFGIQNFIFANGNSTNKAAAKLLRGRSFSVSLLSELAAQHLCTNIGLPTTSIILNVAGKFTILAPKRPHIEEDIQAAETLINGWMLERFYGETLFGFSWTTACSDDFGPDRFSLLWQKIAQASDRKRYRRIDFEKSGGVVNDYLNQFKNDLSSPLCPFCGKRPTHPDSGIEKILPEESSACLTCRDHIHIGAKLVKASKIAIYKADTTCRSEKLRDPILGLFQLSFDMRESLEQLSDRMSLVKFWSIAGWENGLAKNIAVRFIRGYVPVFGQEDENDNRRVHGAMREDKRLELIDNIKEGGAKSFQHIALKALTPKDEGGDKFKGIAALGVLKADIDNLGYIVACGLPEGKQNLARIGTFSRQIDLYLSFYLPHMIANNESFKDIYIIFAGGDDLFVIGPWNRIIDFAEELQKSFAKYVCDNRNITLSAGINLNKASVPIPIICSQAKTALQQAKDNDRDSVTLFDKPVKWSEFQKLIAIRDQLETWLMDETINQAMLFRLNELSDMAQQEHDIMNNMNNMNNRRSIDMRDMECLKWHSLLSYSVTRNVGKKLKGADKNKAIDDVMAVAGWLNEFNGKLKIALWQVLYNQRGGNNGYQFLDGEADKAD